MNCDYCSSCGGKVEYLLNKPNFCPSCGAPMRGGSAVGHKAPTPIRRAPVKADPVVDDPEGTDATYVPALRGLQYEVDQSGGGIGRNHGTIGDLFKSANPGDSSMETVSPQKPQASPKATASKKSAPPTNKPNVMPDAIKQSMKECGSSADSPVDVD